MGTYSACSLCMCDWNVDLIEAQRARSPVVMAVVGST